MHADHTHKYLNFKWTSMNMKGGGGVREGEEGQGGLLHYRKDFRYDFLIII